MNNMKCISTLLLGFTLLSSYAQALITLPTKGRLISRTPGTTFNQQITTSALNTSATATHGQFKILESGYYFLSTDIQANPGRTGLAVIYISASDVVLDLGNRSIVVNPTSTISNSVAIQLAPGVNNITIMNGIISGAGKYADIETGILGVSNTNVTLEDIQVLKCSVAGINFDTAKSLFVKSVHVYGTGSIGMNIYNSLDGAIANSSFSGCLSDTEVSTDNAFGLGADKCRNFALDNVATTNNSSKSGCAFGIYLSGCTGFICNKISTSSNTVTGSGKLCAGLRLLSSSGCSFTDCTANNNKGLSTETTTFGYSISYKSNGNIFNNCESINNIGGNSVAGFWISASRNNTLQGCSSLSNGSTENAAYGIFSSGAGTHNFIRECKSNANYSTAGTAYGIAFSNEKRSVVEKCEINSNDGGTGTAYGIALLDTCVNMVVEYNKIFANTAASAQYGFKDFATNSTTLLRGNTAFGHGRSFANGTSSFTDSKKMNYMLRYSPGGDQMNVQLLIKESDIANLNTFESSSMNWFNYSIVNGTE
ncbi:hypothetical protein FJ364_02505 [Candidatus Dependentiae bacterium]|nr:hypothetical protein [Candidatus Dependentiae bacterium]